MILLHTFKNRILVFVAPLAGAWIEIHFSCLQIVVQRLSLPSRERGLKYTYQEEEYQVFLSRSPRGSVD